MFINENYINQTLKQAENISDKEISSILDKAENMEGLTHTDIAALLVNKNPDHLNRIFSIAGMIKEKIYGNRIVMFAPLYVSDYCVNRCSYCSFNYDNKFKRRKLTMDEIRSEVKALEQMGHKRLALEAGEDPNLCSIDYILETIKTIYDMKCDNGEIRRVNVNIAATTVEDYKKLHDAGIGTYILFQETYHKPTYEKVHISGPKKNYEYHLTAFDRAMEAGIDDVGGGVLFGLADPYFDVLALMIHNEHLENKFGVGFHTISVPRLCKANGMDIEHFPNLVDDQTFEKIVAVLRIAVPFTGLILSTRENNDMRKKLLNSGVSQLSAGSSTEVGGYSLIDKANPQFNVTDERSAFSIITELLDDGYIPSFCTACYRGGRTGDRFMRLAKSGQIKNVCLPNALMTLYEYAMDYGNTEFQNKVNESIKREIPGINNETMKNRTIESITSIKNGGRDYFV